MLRLRMLKLQNFRGYKELTVSFDDSLNVIIGKNDIGKSTILEALEIFFNNNKIKIDIDDLNVQSEEPLIIISCCFEDEEDTVLIDATNRTSCREEYLLNDMKLLEIRKEWSCTGDKLTAASQKVYLMANYPTTYAKPLVQEKIQSLKQMYEKYEADPAYRPTSLTKSAELRKAIYAEEIKEDTEFALTKIDLSKEDAKNIWDSLKQQLPAYYLFESDRKNTDKDAEIQNPLKAATSLVIDSMDEEIRALEETVKEKIIAIGHKTIEKLRELDPEIAESLVPNITLKPMETLFNFDLVSDGDIPLNKRGSGVRRLILLSYFRADAEDNFSADSSRQLIYAVEEPETSQHPDYQKMILETFKDISQNDIHQIIITTHTPEIAKMVEPEQLIFLTKNADGIPQIENDRERKVDGIVESLGVLPYANTETVIYVEGKNDVSFIKNINQNIAELKDIIDIVSAEISIIPLRGGNLVDWINQQYFEKSNIREIYIVDNDVQEYINRVEAIQSADDGRRFGWHTTHRELENYCPPELIANEFALDLRAYTGQWKEIDVPALLKNLCTIRAKNSDEKEKIIKQIINNKLSKQITKQQLLELGVWDEIEKWFLDIRSIHTYGRIVT